MVECSVSMMMAVSAIELIVEALGVSGLMMGQGIGEERGLTLAIKGYEVTGIVM